MEKINSELAAVAVKEVLEGLREQLEVLDLQPKNLIEMHIVNALLVLTNVVQHMQVDAEPR
jgi:hypothetical protein